MIHGSHALAIPFHKLYGRWNKDVNGSNTSLYSVLEFLKLQDFERKSPVSVKLDKFKEIIDEGYYFDSNIPVGYGVGSSGALSAGILRVIIEEGSDVELVQIKSALAAIESYFHGASSGLDPLVSWTNKCIELSSKTDFQLHDSCSLPSDGWMLFLLDTGFPRSTSKYVQIYKEKLHTSPDFKLKIPQLASLNDEAITLFLNSDWKALYQTMTDISTFQYNYFTEMIPHHLKSLWRSGLQNDSFKLKLCGAGGGGYLMGLIRSEDLPELEEYKTIPLN